jgi:branched-chain amino acid transport system substrate-binding protein
LTSKHSWLSRLIVCLSAVAAASALLVACGGDDESGGGGGGSQEKAASPSKCGLGNGKAARGNAIKVGAVITNGAGVDFSSATDAAAAFFKCVNANGGINGRPVQYTVENDELNPEKAGQVASKLVQQRKVDAIVASTSFVDCPVNASLYEKNGYNIIYGVGVPEQCFKSPAFTATNEGPQLSGVGAAQYAVETLGAKKLVGLAPNLPGIGTYTNDGIKAYADEAGVEFKGFINDIPLKDPQSVAVQAAQAAGSDGAVVMVMPVPEDIAVMKAAESSGVADTTKWTCATPCNDLGFPKAVGSFWDGKIFTNSELALTDSKGADNQLWLKVMDQHAGSKDPRDNFSQAGFLAAKIFTDTVLDLKPGELTKENISAAIAKVKNYKTDLLCKPWYWPPKGADHYPNNADRTVVLKGEKQVEAEKGGCFDVSFPNADALRKLEQGQGLNTG